jgi:hypothetical protein
VKRYVKLREQGKPLAPAKAPGIKGKLDGGASKLLEKDLHLRPSVTYEKRADLLCELLGVKVSKATICRAIERLGYTRKKGCEYCDHGCRDVSLGRSDPKKRGLSAFPPIRRPAQRTSRRRRLEPFVTS